MMATLFPNDPIAMIRPQRKIVGMSAILLPFLDGGRTIDWNGLRGHIARTVAAGLIPAVNMDTGYAHLISDETKREVLQHTREITAGRPFVAGAGARDKPGDCVDFAGYQRAIDMIQNHGGTPVIFQSFGLGSLPPGEMLEVYRRIGSIAPKFIAFELGNAFAPFGTIYDLETYRGLLQIPQCIGAKHSSLHRMPEWQRLKLRDSLRPDFMVLTGNDLAIDMVIYGSDYLLGLSTFAPDLFARRDAMWAKGDPNFFELNDLLQYLGFFAFRPPVPAYKHSAAQFLKLRGWIEDDATHPGSPARPESDRSVLADIVDRLNAWRDNG